MRFETKSKRRLRLMTGLLLLCFAVSLTACQSTPRLLTKVETSPPPVVPGYLLLPCPLPYRPPGTALQSDVAVLIEDFKEVVANCNADKAAIAAILERK